MTSKRKVLKYPEHPVDMINSATDLFTNAVTGTTYKEVSLLKVKKEEIVRLLPDKIIYVNTCRPDDIYDNKLNEAIKKLSKLTINSNQLPSGNFRVIKFEDVHQELKHMIEFTKKENDSCFLTQDMGNHESDCHNDIKDTPKHN
jgi:hypothetical protein